MTSQKTPLLLALLLTLLAAAGCTEGPTGVSNFTEENPVSVTDTSELIIDAMAPGKHILQDA